MTDRDRLKHLALKNLQYEFPRLSESKNGNDWMNGHWHGLRNFCIESGLLTQQEIEQAKAEYKQTHGKN